MKERERDLKRETERDLGRERETETLPVSRHDEQETALSIVGATRDTVTGVTIMILRTLPRSTRHLEMGGAGGCGVGEGGWEEGGA